MSKSKSVSDFQFARPVLKELVFNEFETDFEGTFKVQHKVENNISVDNDERMAIVSVSLEINPDFIDNTNTPFYMKIVMDSAFKWSDEMNEEMIDDLLNINAISLIISYIRPIVANLTSSSSYPTYHLPFINLLD